MANVGIIVLITATGTLLALLVLLVWRRQQPAARPHSKREPKLWRNERTLFATTTYEEVGVSPPEPEPKSEDKTAFIAFEQLPLEPEPPPDATAIVSMDAMLAVHELQPQAEPPPLFEAPPSGHAN